MRVTLITGNQVTDVTDSRVTFDTLRVSR